MFLLLVSSGVFQGGLWTLRKANAIPEIAYLPPALPLGMILFLLFTMLVISNLAAATGALFFSKDLELLLASPLSRPQFFGATFGYSYLSCSWMSLLLFLPVLLAFGVFFDSPWTFYLIAILVLIPFFLIPTALAMIIAMLFITLVPTKWYRTIIVLIVLSFLFGLYLIGETLSLSLGDANDTQGVAQIISVISLPDTSWLPSSWVASILEQELLKSSVSNESLLLILLASTALALISLAFILVEWLHSYGLTRVQSLRLSNRGQRRWRFARRLFPGGNRLRSLMVKDLRTVSRELSQSLQILVLLGICLIYLYNLRLFTTIGVVPDESRNNWIGILYILNGLMGAFITTAICTRFVFTSLSLEGGAFWILRTAPISLRDILEAKLKLWYPPIAFVSGVVYATGTLAIGGTPWIVVGNWIFSWIISFGIVGLAVGLSATFARFDWENPSQLAAGFGSLAFMVSSIVLIVVNLTPAWVMLVIFPHHLLGEATDASFIATLSALILMVLLLINYSVATLAIRLGERSLTKRIS